MFSIDDLVLKKDFFRCVQFRQTDFLFIFLLELCFVCFLFFLHIQYYILLFCNWVIQIFVKIYTENGATFKSHWSLNWEINNYWQVIWIRIRQLDCTFITIRNRKCAHFSWYKQNRQVQVITFNLVWCIWNFCHGLRKILCFRWAQN